MTQKIPGTQLDRLESAILGNGREGLISRTARMEESLNNIKDDIKNICEGSVRSSIEFSKLVNNFEVLAIKVDNHHKMQHLADMLKKPKFYAIVFVSFVAMYMAATYAPGVIDFGLTMAGLPPLPIPIP